MTKPGVLSRHSAVGASIDSGGIIVGVLTVRNLDDDVQRRIRLRAAENGRSMEAEARAILSAAVSQNRLVTSWLAATTTLEADEFEADEFELPARTAPRAIDVA